MEMFAVEHPVSEGGTQVLHAPDSLAEAARILGTSTAEETVSRALDFVQLVGETMRGFLPPRADPDQLSLLTEAASTRS